MLCCKPKYVKVVKDRFSYRRKKVPFDTVLRCVFLTSAEALVALEKTGKCWIVKPTDLKILELQK